MLAYNGLVCADKYLRVLPYDTQEEINRPHYWHTTRNEHAIILYANYDMDRFRRFLKSPSFATTYNITDERMEKLKVDDHALMHFDYSLLKQILFGDVSITEQDGAYEKRIEERGEIIKMPQQAEREHIMANDPRYQSKDNVKDKDLQ